MSFRAWLCRDGGPASPISDREALARNIGAGAGLVWVDFQQPDQEDEPVMSGECGLHVISVQDCLGPETHFPRAHDFPGYSALTLHGINHQTDASIVRTAELMLFVSERLVVSCHRTDLPSIQAVAHLAEENGSPMSRGPAFLAYALADSLIENILPTLERMADFADEVEEQAIRSPRQETLDAVLRLKRSASTLSRVLTVQRELLNRLSREQSGYLSGAGLLFRDAYERLVAIEDLAISLRERAQDAMSTYLSSVANRQNESMRMLAIVATAFLPMGILVGAFGMNFSDMPGIEWAGGFYAVVAAIALTLIVVFSVFWFRNWIDWGRRGVSQLSSFKVAEEHLSAYAVGLKYLMVDIPVESGRRSLRLGRLLKPLLREKPPDHRWRNDE